MITYKDIKKAINALLTKEFNVEINSNDVKEGFIRPSFFVSFDNPIRSSTVDQIEKSLTIRIHYFPTDQYSNSLELLDMQEQLGNLFDLKLPVKNRFFNIIEAFPTVTDGVLEFSFDIEFSEAKNISYEDDNRYVDEFGQPLLDENGKPIEIEIMKTLDIKKGVN